MTDFLKDNMYVLVPVIYILGMFLKGTPKVKDWMIPYLLLLVSIVLAISINGINANSIVQGILVAGVTVTGNQLIKQASKSTENDGGGNDGS